MKKVFNRKARFNYDILERFEAGVILSGPEVKSVKQGNIRLDDAFIRIDKNQEAWLVNSHIHPYKFAMNKDFIPNRSRKILLHAKEILAIQKIIEAKNLALVPTSCYTKKGKVKLELALAKGKKQWQKKEAIKKRDLQREMARELKEIG